MQAVKLFFLDERIHYPLLTALIEFDIQLVAINMNYGAIAEFVVEHPAAGTEDLAVLVHDLALGRCAVCTCLNPACIPVGRASRTIKAGVSAGFDMFFRQLVDKAGGDRGCPVAIDAAVGSIGDKSLFSGAGDADLGQTALFLQPF